MPRGKRKRNDVKWVPNDPMYIYLRFVGRRYLGSFDLDDGSEFLMTNSGKD